MGLDPAIGYPWQLRTMQSQSAIPDGDDRVKPVKPGHDGVGSLRATPRRRHMRIAETALSGYRPDLVEL
jgi:hypothetical protein